MLARRRLRALGATLVLLGLAPAIERSARGQPADPAPERSARGQPADPAPEQAPASEHVPTVNPTPAVDPDAILDIVLPCGLRVLAAQDISLPVAAVILAVETGSEDDPPESPGLVHALAYHLHQGNRELRPGEAIAAAQDAGGLHMLATGPGQVRFESVVPISRVSEVLFAESQRLRHPTLDRRRWEISLGWAGSDARSRLGLRPKDLAALHGAPGLAHDGRAVDRSLADIAPASLAAALARNFNYSRATLIVVAPESPAALLEQVKARFADLPSAPRSVPTRPQPPTRAPLPDAPDSSPPAATEPTSPGANPPAPPVAPGANSPTPTPAPTKPTLLAWPVPATAAAAAWAGVVCRALNRQKRDPDEPRKARLACDYDPDPRRGLVLVRPLGTDDPLGLVRARLARLGAADQPLLAAQAQFVAQMVRLFVRTPLGLARQLAGSAPAPLAPAPSSVPVARRRDDLTGLASLGGARPAFTLTVEDALILGPAEPRP